LNRSFPASAGKVQKQSIKIVALRKMLVA